MGTGAITEYVDVAQLVLYAFWVFFAGLIYYLVRENHREGYPVTEERGGQTGWPIPDPKTYHLADGSTIDVPRATDPQPVLRALPSAPHAGAPLVPTGDPMTDEVGPGAYALRADVVELNFEGDPKIVPMRVKPDYMPHARDVDPRGLPVIGGDGEPGGTVVDLWVDLSEVMIRYLEVAVPTAGAVRNVLVPINFARIRRHRVEVRSIFGEHFAQVPVTRDAVTVTMLEEERIMAFYGAGTLYASPRRAEPML